LVHKVSIDQVLLTSYEPLSNLETLLYAQLPRSHGFYCEHLIEPKRYDLVALIEMCRQACFVTAHTQFGVPLEGNGFQFLFQDLDAALIGTRLAAIGENADGQPTQLLVRSLAEQQWKKKSGTVSGVLWHFSITTLDDREIAQIRIRQTWIERTKWREIRQMMRKERNITPEMKIPSTTPSELTPSDVARLNPHNIVLHDVRQLDEKRFEASARIDTRHPVLFDRATEHIYAMIQIEVCRQLALYATSRAFGVDALELDVWKCKSSFNTVGELQLATKVVATIQIDDPARLSATVQLAISQQDREVSVFSVSVRRMI
jgi:hypothetical protein